LLLFTDFSFSLQQLAKETRQHMVKRMERHERASRTPLYQAYTISPSPKQTYRKAPFASAEERKYERRKRVRGREPSLR